MWGGVTRLCTACWVCARCEAQLPSGHAAVVWTTHRWVLATDTLVSPCGISAGCKCDVGWHPAGRAEIERAR